MAVSTGAAILGSSIVSGFLGDRGASRAADAQRDASRASIAEQRRQFDAMMERSKPFYEGSLNAYNSLLSMEGLSGAAPAPSIANPKPPMPGYKMMQLEELRDRQNGRPTITSRFL